MKHPILLTNNLQRELTELLLSHPDSFLSEYKNVELNITRYNSYLNSAKKSPEQKLSYRKILENHKNKLEIMSAILKDTLYARQHTSVNE